MSKNNTIRKSDKKFIRLEKARIRRQFLDVKKQQELIDELYKRFTPTPKTKVLKNEKTEKAPEPKELKKEKTETKKPEAKKEKDKKVK